MSSSAVSALLSSRIRFPSPTRRGEPASSDSFLVVLSRWRLRVGSCGCETRYSHRFSFFWECCLTSLQKEAVYNHIKQLSLPYTIIDIGWWYQLAYPRLESGKLDYAMTAANNEIIGEGNTPMALTDLRDIGRWVSRIISDDRTLNKMVFAYDTVMTQNQIYSLLEEISGEEVVRNHVCLFSSGISASTNYSRSPKNSFRTESSPPASQVKPILSTPSSLFPAIWLNTNSRGAFEATTLPSTPNTLAT